MQIDKRKVILLCNLGTPTSTKTSEIRDFLRSLLSDPNMIKQSPLWRFLLKFIILPLSTIKAKKRYSCIWSKEGSPLFVYTKNLASKLEIELNKQTEAETYKVLFAMNYSEPKFDEVLSKLEYNTISSLTIVPLFPQYSLSTTGSIEASLIQTLKINSKLQTIPLNFVKSFSENRNYIDALITQINKNLKDKKIDSLLISFHSLPNSLIEKGDPYKKMCEKLFIDLENNLKDTYRNIKICYQSAGKFGKWLHPTLKEKIISAINSGEKNIAIISPSFLTECSETLVDIKQDIEMLFKNKGGENLIYIPCLNDEHFWIKNFAKIIINSDS